VRHPLSDELVEHMGRQVHHAPGDTLGDTNLDEHLGHLAGI
jgi:hypothetical protein